MAGNEFNAREKSDSEVSADKDGKKDFSIGIGEELEGEDVKEVEEEDEEVALPFFVNRFTFLLFLFFIFWESSIIGKA